MKVAQEYELDETIISQITQNEQNLKLADQESHIQNKTSSHVQTTEKHELAPYIRHEKSMNSINYPQQLKNLSNDQKENASMMLESNRDPLLQK